MVSLVAFLLGYFAVSLASKRVFGLRRANRKQVESRDISTNELHDRAQCAIDYFATDGDDWKQVAHELQEERHRTAELLDKQYAEILQMKQQLAAAENHDDSDPGSWRIGSKIPLNVYDGNRAVCQTHNPEDAARIVAAVNSAGKETSDDSDPGNECPVCQRTLARNGMCINCDC